MWYQGSSAVLHALVCVHSAREIIRPTPWVSCNRCKSFPPAPEPRAHIELLLEVVPMSDVDCCRSRKLALSLTSLREVGVCSPARKSADTFATSGCFLRGHDARVSMLLQANGSIWRDNASWFWLVAAARRTPFRGPWQKPPFVRAYAGQGAVTPPRSQATLCHHAPGMPTPASEDFITASSSTSVPSAHCPKDRDP